MRIARLSLVVVLVALAFAFGYQLGHAESGPRLVNDSPGLLPFGVIPLVLALAAACLGLGAALVGLVRARRRSGRPATARDRWTG